MHPIIAMHVHIAIASQKLYTDAEPCAEFLAAAPTAIYICKGSPAGQASHTHSKAEKLDIFQICKVIAL